MKKNEEEIYNLGKKIYLLCYTKPRYKMEISEMIYGDPKKKSIYPEIKKLEKKGWIKKADNKIIDYFKDKLDLSGRNAEKRQYYISSYKPLKIAIIERYKDKNVEFSKEELEEFEKILYMLLSRHLIDNIIKSCDLRKNIDLFDRVLDNINFFNSMVLWYAIEEDLEKYYNKKYIRVNHKLSKFNPYSSKLIHEYLGLTVNYLEELDLDGLRKNGDNIEDFLDYFEEKHFG